MDANIEQFIGETEKSLAKRSFIKLVLSNYKGSERGLQKISVREIETKKGHRLMFQTSFETRDIVKNFEVEESIAQLRDMLGSGFRNAHLFTTGGDHQLIIGKRSSRLTKGRATNHDKPDESHDRKKRTLIDPNAFYLKALGIADDNGRIKPSQQDKWRQISKFVEILAGLIENSPLKGKASLKIVDMGSGKGYLTFAAYDYFSSRFHVERDSHSALRSPRSALEMTGVELRPELVDLCNDIAKAGNFDGLEFVKGTIADFNPGEIDILIALHACDTATDDALFKGIASKATIIVAAPCCHKEIRKQIKPPEILAGILKHGIMLERTAETITDGLRALILEREGYSTKLFEFVPTEHTPKNNMLVGMLTSHLKNSEGAKRQISQIKSLYGIGHFHIERLLSHGNFATDEKSSSSKKFRNPK